MNRFAIWIVVLAGVAGGCSSRNYYRGRVLLAPDAAGEKFDAFGDSFPDGAVGRLGTGRFGHANFVRRIVYSPDGKMIASWGGDMRCRFWDASSGRLIWATPPWYRMPTFSPDRRQVALCFGADVHLVSMASGKVVTTFRNHKREITWIGFVGGGGLVTIANDRTIRVWSVLLGVEVRKIELGRVGVQSLGVAAISPNGKLLAVSTAYSSVSLYDLDRGECIRRLKTPRPAWVTSLAFSPNGQTLCGRLSDSNRLFWNLAGGRLCDGTAPISRPGTFAVSPDGRTIAYASGARIRLEDIRTGAELPTTARIPGHDRGLTMMAFRPGGKSNIRTLTTAGSDDIRQWAVRIGRDRMMLAAPDNRGEKWIALSADGRWAVSLSRGGLVGVYDIAAGRRLALIEGGAEKITGAALSGDGPTLVTASRDSIGLWNVPAGTLKQAISLPKQKYLAVTSPGLTADGKTVAAVVCQPNPRLNDDIRLKARGTSHALPREVRCIEVFDVPAGRSRGRIPGMLFALGPDSRTLAKSGDRSIELWDLPTLKRTGSIKCAAGLLSSAVGATMRLRFSPDGRKLARAFIAPIADGKWNLGGNGCVELFYLGGGASQILKVDDVAAAPVVAFSADSRTLAAAGANGGILLWDISKPPKAAAAP